MARVYRVRVRAAFGANACDRRGKTRGGVGGGGAAVLFSKSGGVRRPLSRKLTRASSQCSGRLGTRAENAFTPTTSALTTTPRALTFFFDGRGVYDRSRAPPLARWVVVQRGRNRARRRARRVPPRGPLERLDASDARAPRAHRASRRVQLLRPRGGVGVQSRGPARRAARVPARAEPPRVPEAVRADDVRRVPHAHGRPGGGCPRRRRAPHHRRVRGDESFRGRGRAQPGDALAVHP